MNNLLYKDHMPDEKLMYKEWAFIKFQRSFKLDLHNRDRRILAIYYINEQGEFKSKAFEKAVKSELVVFLNETPLGNDPNYVKWHITEPHHTATGMMVYTGSARQLPKRNRKESYLEFLDCKNHCEQHIWDIIKHIYEK